MEQVKKELDQYIKGLSVKKTKSSGKKYFYDTDDFLVLDITVRSRMVYTHENLFPMLEGCSKREMSDMIVEVLNNNGHNASGVIFLNYTPEKETFRSLENEFGTDFALMCRFIRGLEEDSKGKKVNI